MAQENNTETDNANVMAIASLVLGIIALLSSLTGQGSLVGIICGITGIVLGAKARRLLPVNERTIATVGWICSIVALSICAILFVTVCGLLGLIIGFAE